jgi:hypothetical protein
MQNGIASWAGITDGLDRHAAMDAGRDENGMEIF